MEYFDYNLLLEIGKHDYSLFRTISCVNKELNKNSQFFDVSVNGYYKVIINENREVQSLMIHYNDELIIHFQFKTIKILHLILNNFLDYDVFYYRYLKNKPSNINHANIGIYATHNIKILNIIMFSVFVFNNAPIQYNGCFSVYLFGFNIESIQKNINDHKLKIRDVINKGLDSHLKTRINSPYTYDVNNKQNMYKMDKLIMNYQVYGAMSNMRKECIEYLQHELISRV